MDQFDRAIALLSIRNRVVHGFGRATVDQGRDLTRLLGEVLESWTHAAGPA